MAKITNESQSRDTFERKTISGVYAALLSDMGKILDVDTSGGACTINMFQVSTANGVTNSIIIQDESGNAGTNSITINAFAGDTINGVASLVLSQNSISTTLSFVDNTKIEAPLTSTTGLLSSLPTTNITWVLKNGNDGTGLINRLDRPFLTIGAAITASPSGHTVWVGPGIFDEQITLKNGVNLHFEDSELRDTSGGAGFIFRDNGVVVTCDITGSAKLLTTGKQGILLTAASVIKTDIYSMVDTSAGANYVSVGATAKLVLNVKSASLTSGASFGGIENSGTLRLTCPDFVGSVTNVVGTSEVHGSVTTVIIFGGYMLLYANTRKVTATAGEIDIYGDVTSNNISSAVLVDVETATVNIYGNLKNITPGSGGRGIRMTGACVVNGVGNIYCSDCMGIQHNAGTITWRGDIEVHGQASCYTQPGFATQANATFNECNFLCGNAVIGAQNSHVLSTVTIQGGSIKNDGGFNVVYALYNYLTNAATTSIFRISNCRIENTVGGVQVIDVNNDNMILDNVTLVGATNSIASGAARTIKLYGSSTATTVANANITFTVNVGGLFVNAGVI